METIKKNIYGILVCLVIAIPSWLLGKQFPVIGGAVISILAGMIITMFWKEKGKAAQGSNGLLRSSYRQLSSY